MASLFLSEVSLLLKAYHLGLGMCWGLLQALIHSFPTRLILTKSAGLFQRYGLLISPLPPKLHSSYLGQFFPEFLDLGLVLNVFVTPSPTPPPLSNSSIPFSRYPLPPKLRYLYLGQSFPEFLDLGLVLNALFTRSPTPPLLSNSSIPISR